MLTIASAGIMAYVVAQVGLTLLVLTVAARVSVRVVCRERLAIGRALVVAAGLVVCVVVGVASANFMLGVWNANLAGGFGTPIGDPPKQLGFMQTPMIWLLTAATLCLLSATALFWAIRRKRLREALLLAAASGVAVGVAFVWWIVCLRLASAIIEALR